MKSVIINKNDAGQRVDKFLFKTLNAIPKSLLYKYLRTKKIKLNRRRAEPAAMLSEGDVLDLYIPDEFFAAKTSREAFTVLLPRIDVVYEDSDMLLVNKRPGISCVPDKHEAENTLVSHIKAYLYRKGEFDLKSENSFAPALCNRIDRNTGGIVIAAKNAQTLRRINEQIRAHEIEKKYLCVVHGTPEKREDTLRGWLIKDAETNKVSVFDKRPPNGDAKTILTAYKVLESKNGLSLLEVVLLTGRTHQIRAHLASIGHPLLGDGKYGINREDRRLGYKYQALYSYSVTIGGRTYSIEPGDIWFVKELFGEIR